MPSRFENANCRYCGEPILFYSLILNAKGTLQPLDLKTYKNHRCPSPENPFNKRRAVQTKFNRWMTPKAERQQAEVHTP